MNLYKILQNPDRVGEGMTHFERLFAQKIGGGSAVITGVPPLLYIGDGRPLTDYLISGNTVQDGTPTPENPVDATGCGVRTENLAPPLSEWVDGYINSGTGTIHDPSDASEKTSEFLEIPNNATNVAFSGEDGRFEEGPSGAWRTIGFYDSNYAFISRLGGNGTNAMIVAVPEGAAFMRICCRTYGSDKNCMLNLGSTALPYEPYGFKLPLTVNGVEYPIYLGTVPTTRRVKKLVLTGEEEIAIRSGNAKWFIPIADLRVPTTASILWYCSHYQAVANNAPWASYDYMISWSTTDTGSSNGLRIRDVNFLTGVTVADFKSYLAAQYAAGTPVTVWYVLAEPETGIVNEPLMKIGDYADTISAAQAGVTIPTVSGANVLDVPTTVPPSEVLIRVRIKEV